jgi:hypothetical protein
VGDRLRVEVKDPLSCTGDRALGFDRMAGVAQRSLAGAAGEKS